MQQPLTVEWFGRLFLRTTRHSAVLQGDAAKCLTVMQVGTNSCTTVAGTGTIGTVATANAHKMPQARHPPRPNCCCPSIVVRGP